MNSSKKTFNVLNNRALRSAFFVIVAVAAFVAGSWIVALGYKESWFGHAILIGVIAMLFFVAVGEFASNIGGFSAIGYVIVTFLRRLHVMLFRPYGKRLMLLT